jgi:hypothetical protein
VAVIMAMENTAREDGTPVLRAMADALREGLLEADAKGRIPEPDLSIMWSLLVGIDAYAATGLGCTHDAENLGQILSLIRLMQGRPVRAVADVFERTARDAIRAWLCVPRHHGRKRVPMTTGDCASVRFGLFLASFLAGLAGGMRARERKRRQGMN